MRERLRVSGLAIVSVLVFFLIATGLFGAELKVGVGDEVRELTIVNVAVLTIVTSVLAMGLAAIVDRFRWGRAAWTTVAFVVLSSSIFAVFGLELATEDLIWQLLLHAVFGLLLIVGFYVGWPEKNV